MMDSDRDPFVPRPDPPSESGGVREASSRIASRQRLRLQRTALAVANYALIGFYTLYLYLSDQLALGPIAVIAVYLVVVVAYGFVFGLIATGRNRHFPDPSLTLPQLMLAAGLTVVMFAFARTLFAQDLYFFAFMMSLLFSAFRLNLKQILMSELPAFGGFAAILLLHHGLIHETLGAAAERVAIYLASMGWMITFAASISHLRQVLSSRNKALKQSAARDDLTGAYNRRYLFQALEREIERSKRSGEPLSVCMFDIDHFKAINDSHGHQVGDEILCELITRARDSIRGADELQPLAEGPMLGRFGGEEFFITLPLTDRDGATNCGERVLEAIRSLPFPTRFGPVKVSASLGIAQYNSTQDTIESLIGRVDEALYQAKENGRDQVMAAPVASPVASTA